MRRARTNESFVDVVPRLLEARGWSIRQLAREAGVEPGHLWKVLRRRNYKTAGAAMAGRVAVALDLPVDYFPEYREGSVIEQIRSDPALRDAAYDRIARQQGRPAGAATRKIADRRR